MNEPMTDGTETRSIELAVLEVLHQVIPDQGAAISMDTDLFEENVLDSFALIQLIVRLSEKFDVEIPPATFDRHEWATPSAIVASVAKRLSRKSAPETAL
jgi:D-alanine--poly(phosphoribitol) ligase subunit 2